MRNITAKELDELAQYHLAKSNLTLSKKYEEEEELQTEMNRD